MAESFVDLIQGYKRDREAKQAAIYGVVVGIVTRNKPDPNEPWTKGCIKVKFPWLHDTEESWWARTVQIFAGKDRGAWFIPEIDDEVLIAFEHGDVRKPYCLGSLWNKVDGPPAFNKQLSKLHGNPADHKASKIDTSGRDFNEDGKNDLFGVQMRNGAGLMFDQKKGSEHFSITSGGTDGNQMRLEMEEKKNLFSVISDKGDVHITAGKTLYMECEDMLISCRGNYDCSVKSNWTTKVGSVMKAQSGSNYEAKSGAEMKMVSDANHTIKGSNVLIN